MLHTMRCCTGATIAQAIPVRLVVVALPNWHGLPSRHASYASRSGTSSSKRLARSTMPLKAASPGTHSRPIQNSFRRATNQPKRWEAALEAPNEPRYSKRPLLNQQSQQILTNPEPKVRLSLLEDDEALMTKASASYLILRAHQLGISSLSIGCIAVAMAACLMH